MTDDSTEATPTGTGSEDWPSPQSLLTLPSTFVLPSHSSSSCSSAFADYPEFKPWLGGKSCALPSTVPLPVTSAILEMEAGKSVDPGDLGLVWQRGPEREWGCPKAIGLLAIMTVCHILFLSQWPVEMDAETLRDRHTHQA